MTRGLVDDDRTCILTLNYSFISCYTSSLCAGLNSCNKSLPLCLLWILSLFNCRMEKLLWNINHWRTQIPQTCCVPARFVSLLSLYESCWCTVVLYYIKWISWLMFVWLLCEGLQFSSGVDSEFRKQTSSTCWPSAELWNRMGHDQCCLIQEKSSKSWRR